MLTFYEVEYTDPDGKPHKAMTQAVNGLHTEDKLREHFALHKQFGEGANITSIKKLTDSATIATAEASRPPLPAEIVKNIQAQETAANPPVPSAPVIAPA